MKFSVTNEVFNNVIKSKILNVVSWSHGAHCGRGGGEGTPRGGPLPKKKGQTPPVNELHLSHFWN